AASPNSCATAPAACWSRPATLKAWRAPARPCSATARALQRWLPRGGSRSNRIMAASASRRRRWRPTRASIGGFDEVDRPRALAGDRLGGGFRADAGGAPALAPAVPGGVPYHQRRLHHRGASRVGAARRGPVL